MADQINRVKYLLDGKVNKKMIRLMLLSIVTNLELITGTLQMYTGMEDQKKLLDLFGEKYLEMKFLWQQK